MRILLVIITLSVGGVPSARTVSGARAVHGGSRETRPVLDQSPWVVLPFIFGDMTLSLRLSVTC